MTAAENGKAADAEAAPPVRIILTFGGPGLADITVSAAGVSLAQLMGAAFYLDCLAREARAGAVAKDAMRQLDIPFGDVLAKLRAEGRL